MAAPSAPVINEQPLAEDQKLSFQWEPQASVDDFYIYDNDGVSTLLTSVPGNIIVTTVTGLTNGQTYNAFISASNVNGMGSPSFFRPFQPGLPPTEAPLTATATKVGASNVLIEWTPAGESLVAPIQWYVIEAVSSDPAASNFRFTADGLKPETTYLATNFNPYSYTFTVQGVNCPGYSPAAVTNSVSFAPAGAGGSWSYVGPGEQTLLTNESPFGWLPGTGSFTFEFFINITSFFTNQSLQLYLGGYSGSDVAVIQLVQYTGKGTRKEITIGSAEELILPYTNLLTSNTWYHFAVSRNGGTGDTALWINGTRESLSNDTTDWNSRGTFPDLYFSQSDPVSFYLTNLHFMQGAFKYNPVNATITVPTSAITSNADTVALWLATDASNIFTDSGPNAYTTLNDSAITWASNTPF